MQPEFLLTLQRALFFVVFILARNYEGKSQLFGVKNYFLLLKSKKIAQYTANYEELFRSKGENEKRHTTSIYIADSTFHLLKFVLDSYPESHDGVRIFFASYNDFVDTCITHQADKDQITLLMVPTINKKESFEDLYEFYNLNQKLLDDDIYNHGELCPNACDNSGLIGTAMYPAKIKAQIVPFSIPEAAARQYIKNYADTFCRDNNPDHTKSLWLSRENFTFLDSFFNSDTSKQYSGIRIFFASYKKKIKKVQNKNKNQISLIFTAAGRSAPHRADFGALLSFYKSHKFFFKTNNNCGELTLESRDIHSQTINTP